MKLKALLPHFALLAVNLLYGANYVIAKGLMPDVIGPSGFILLRVIGATLLFWLVLLFVRREQVSKKDLGRMALCAVFGVAANQLLFFHGLSRTSPLNSSLIMLTTPVLVLLMARFILGEALSRRKAFGITCGTIGAMAVIALSTGSAQAEASVEGDLMILGNASCYALYLVLVKPLMTRYRPLTVITGVFSFGLLYVIPFGLVELQSVDWAGLSSAEVSSLAYVVIGVTFFAYLLNLFALSRVSPSVVSAYIYLQPLLAASFAWLFHHYGWSGAQAPEITWPLFFAAMVIVLGVYLVSSGRRVVVRG